MFIHHSAAANKIKPIKLNVYNVQQNQSEAFLSILILKRHLTDYFETMNQVGVNLHRYTAIKMELCLFIPGEAPASSIYLKARGPLSGAQI